jgi:hypothetical protein
MARFLTIAAAVALLSISAAFGGSSSSQNVASSQGVQATPARTSVGSQTSEIAQDWELFFAGSTPASEKVKLLQNGQRFSALIQAQAQSPLAKQTRAKVLRVTLLSPTRARVVYSIVIAGKPALKHQTGVAVRVDGVWKVGDASFCRLLALQGPLPRVCKSG